MEASITRSFTQNDNSPLTNFAETCGLEEAASLLNMGQESLRRKAKSGEIPGAKIGRNWVFIKADLVQHLRNSYHREFNSDGYEKWLSQKNSTKEAKSGGTDSHIQELLSKFANQQKLATKR